MIVLIAVIVSVEWILAAAALWSHVPVPVDLGFIHSIMPSYQRTFQPQRDLFLYFLWMTMGAGLYLGLRWLRILRPQTDFKSLALIHGLLVFLMGHASFEIVAMGNPVWAWPLFWGAFATGIVVSIFWPECLTVKAVFNKHCSSLKIHPWVPAVLGCLFIFLVIYMPDLQSVVAMVYMGEYFHNWDTQLFGTVYAVAHGLIPGLDVIPTYGFGVAVMVAKIVQWMGGFDYARILGIIMWVGIIYYSLWFLLMRRFLASGLLAFAAVIFTIRMQMFNLMIEPFIWAPVMSSVFRDCFDIGVFWILWMHIQTRKVYFLSVGAFLVSVGLYYLWTTGVYMLLMFGLYTAASAFVPCLGGGHDRLRWRNHGLVMASVVAWTVSWFYLTVGTHLWDASFWHHLVEYNSYFIRGVFSDRLTMPLSRNNNILGIGGLLYPVFYLGTLLYTAGKVMDGKIQKRDIFAALLAFYGLEIHSYYIVRASQWYTIGFPGIFLCFYWIVKMLENAPAYWRRPVTWSLVLVALYCLMTDRLFVGYPNLLNFSRNPIVDGRTAFRVGPNHIPYFHQLLADFPESFKLSVNSIGVKDEGLRFDKDFANDVELKKYYVKETAWPEDAALIKRLTPEGSRVALLSSFEVLLLQKADRKPFFYYFPLINSRPMAVRNFMVTELFSVDQLQRVLDQLEGEKPQYIFMERIFLTSQVPQAYMDDFPDLIVLLRYIRSSYDPVDTGKYLVAMKRR